MAIDIKKLDEKIRKLQMIRELADDPEIAAMLSDVVVSNGVKPLVASIGPAVQPMTDGGRLFFAERAVRILGESGSFTGRDVTNKMTELGYTFTAKDPSVATYGALVLLLEKGVIRVAQKGAPGKAAKYQLGS